MAAGSANPSIATLLRISDALGIGLPALVDMDDQPGLRVARAGAAPVLWRGKLGAQAVLVVGTEPPDVTDLWDWTFAPGDSASSARDLAHEYVNASSAQVARFSLTAFEPGVGPGSRSEATDA